MTLERAKSTIGTYNLSEGKVDEDYDDTIPEGTVISQYPTAGTEVAEGDQVNLIVSKGPDPSTLPPEPTEVSKTIYIPMPGDAEGLMNVRVLVDGEEVLNQALDATMSAQVPVTVTGTGVKTVTYYFNGEYGGSMTVDLTQADGT